jgi:hypothetical protein
MERKCLAAASSDAEAAEAVDPADLLVAAETAGETAISADAAEGTRTSVFGSEALGPPLAAGVERSITAPGRRPGSEGGSVPSSGVVFSSFVSWFEDTA